MNPRVARAADLLYRKAPALYRLLYRPYKVWTDRAELKLLRSIVTPGMTVVDVGANIGILTLELARLVGPNGRVYAFEPDPTNYGRLVPYTKGLANVEAVNAAVGSRSGEITLFVSDALNVDHHTYDDGEGRQRLTVPVVAMDDFFRDHGEVGFIKMDIQGFEVEALRGCRELIARSSNIQLILEVWPYGLRRARSSTDSLLRLLQEMGLTWSTIGQSDVDLATLVEHPEVYVNAHVRRG